MTRPTCSRVIALVLLGVLIQPLSAAERWYNHYKKGLDLMDEEKYAQAILEFEMATEGVYEDQPKKIQTYGMHFIRYYPHREIGIAAFHLNDYDRARQELELSLSYASSDRADEYLQKIPGRQGIPSIGEAPSPQLSEPERKKIQRVLAYEGFYGGEIDGILGPGSSAAIKSFQKKHDIDAHGRLTDETIQLLFKSSIPDDWTPGQQDQPRVADKKPETRPVAAPSRPPPSTRPESYHAVRRVGPRLTIAVVPMADRGGASALAELMAEKIITSLVEFQRFRVIERGQLDKILKEQKFGLSDLVEPSSAAELGKIVGVDCLVVGSAWVSKGIVDLNTRLVDTETGEVLATRAGQCRHDSPAETRNIAAEMAAYYANILPLAEGTVVKVDSDQSVFIDLGSRSGMKKGMKLVVFHEGDEIRHPTTGEVIGSRREKQAELVLTEVMESLSMARFVEGETGNVSVADPVVTK